MAVPVAQQRKLLQRSGNVCAFPGCRLLLTAEGTPDDPVVVLGEIAHIVAESPDGPRGKSSLALMQRNSYPNLILLCNQHHQLVDSEAALEGQPKITGTDPGTSPGSGPIKDSQIVCPRFVRGIGPRLACIAARNRQTSASAGRVVGTPPGHVVGTP